MSAQRKRQQHREAAGRQIPEHLQDLLARDAEREAKKGGGKGDGNAHSKPHGRRGGHRHGSSG